MGYLMNDGLSPDEAGAKSIKEEPQRLEPWLAGVTTYDGQPGLAAVKAALGL
ncbi:hypothetical protein D3C71_2173500 [compost metagenome]